MADVCVIAPGGKVGDGVVDIAGKKIVEWNWVTGMQPIVSDELIPMNSNFFDRLIRLPLKSFNWSNMWSG